MKKIITIFLYFTFITLQAQNINQIIANEIYLKIDPNKKLLPCENLEKSPGYQLSFIYESETFCLDYSSIDNLQSEILNKEYISYISTDIFKNYNRLFCKKRRNQFKKTCWSIDRKTIIEENMCDNLRCVNIQLRINLYFQK